jgi:hypothetical protein
MAIFKPGKDVPWTQFVGFLFVYSLTVPCIYLYDLFQKSVERRAQSLAGEILKLSSCLGVQPIPFAVLTRGAADIGPASRSLLTNADRPVVENSLKWLMKQLQKGGYSVISLDMVGGAYSLNPIASEAIRQSMDAREQEEWVRRTASVLAGSGLPADESQATGVGSHVAAILALADQLHLDTGDIRRQFGCPM